MGKILEMMNKMKSESESVDRGVFVMSKETIRKFRKETKSFAGIYLGHKVRMIKACPNENIYLMSNEDYIVLKIGTEKAKENQIKKYCENLPNPEKLNKL